MAWPRKKSQRWAGRCLLLLVAWLVRSATFVTAPGTWRRAPPAPPASSAALSGAAASWLLSAGRAHAAGGDAGLDDIAIDPANAIVQAFLLTFVSEIGDKTFFIAAILAAGGGSSAEGGGNTKVLTFFGAIAALVVMTLLAVGLGQAFHAVPDLAGGAPIDDYASVLIFGFFGAKLLYEGLQMEDGGSLLDEKEEAEEAVRDASWAPTSAVAVLLPPLVLRAFVLVFAAEVGDRSFISAAALSAQGGPPGAAAVFVGGISAHTIATLAAVLLGDLISNYISEKQLTLIGGTLFLAFAGLSAASLAAL